MTIEAPIHEVAEITATIEFVGGHKVTFTMDRSINRAEGEQPWLGKSADVRQAIFDAISDEEFWDDGQVECPNCGERVDPSEMNHWPLLAEPISMCDSCVHNARRSGWEPGQ